MRLEFPYNDTGLPPAFSWKCIIYQQDVSTRLLSSSIVSLPYSKCLQNHPSPLLFFTVKSADGNGICKLVYLYTSPSAPKLLLLQNLQLYSIALSVTDIKVYPTNNNDDCGSNIGGLLRILTIHIHVIYYGMRKHHKLFVYLITDEFHVEKNNSHIIKVGLSRGWMLVILDKASRELIIQCWLL